jgi:hypothetical protein
VNPEAAIGTTDSTARPGAGRAPKTEDGAIDGATGKLVLGNDERP